MNKDKMVISKKPKTIGTQHHHISYLNNPRHGSKFTIEMPEKLKISDMYCQGIHLKEHEILWLDCCPN